VVTVRCGSNHTCAITDTGEVFAWGKGDSGQLGLGGTPARVSTPVRETTTNQPTIDCR